MSKQFPQTDGAIDFRCAEACAGASCEPAWCGDSERCPTDPPLNWQETPQGKKLLKAVERQRCQTCKGEGFVPGGVNPPDGTQHSGGGQ